jgi:hypothetical protein
VPKISAKKPSAVASEELTPFKSFLVASTAKTLKPETLSEKILPQVQTLTAGKWRQSVSDVVGPFEDPNVHAAFFTYVEERPPGWARASDLRDVINHVVIACRGKSKAKNHVAFFFSDNAVRDKAAEKISKQEGALGTLAAIPPATMNAAYVGGQAITLWMSGTHRRVATKVDNKVISGLDLQFALDPLEDQSFFFTAARSRLSNPKIDRPVGSSPRRSRLWLGPSHDWADFSKTIGVLFDLVVGATTPVANPLPILAGPVLDPASLASVDDAYDVALIPPELLDPSTANVETLDLRDRLGSVALEAFDPDGPNFSVRVHQPVGTAIGTLDLTFSIATDGRASWTVDDEADAGVAAEVFAEVVGVLRERRGWLKVWYDSGHTLADESFFEGRFRDQPFTSYFFEKFPAINITREKPDPITRAAIGAQDSLFCWVKNRWTVPGSGVAPGRGWLACDDGSMEKADFLHIDTINGMPTLSLIHVKGSSSDKATRRLSVSDYEVVTSQAVKNLRWVDQGVLGDALAGRLVGRIGDKVWRNGGHATAAQFLDAVKALGADYNRNVVVLQPRARKSVVESSRKKPKDNAEHVRLLQLDALLLGARANVVGLNANLYVIGEDS